MVSWEDSTYKIAWFLESATALRLASANSCAANNERLPHNRGPGDLIATLHGALYYFGAYYIQGGLEPLTQADFMRLPREVRLHMLMYNLRRGHLRGVR